MKIPVPESLGTGLAAAALIASMNADPPLEEATIEKELTQVKEVVDLVPVPEDLVGTDEPKAQTPRELALENLAGFLNTTGQEVLFNQELIMFVSDQLDELKELTAPASCPEVKPVSCPEPKTVVKHIKADCPAPETIFLPNHETLVEKPLTAAQRLRAKVDELSVVTESPGGF